MTRRAFTLVELLVVTGIAVLLLAIVVPYGMSLREQGHRTACLNNLRQVERGLKEYAAGNGYVYPRVVYDAQTRPNEWAAFTGADDADPFIAPAGGGAGTAEVAANDVTASLWLLVRGGMVTDPAVFVCPSSGDTPDRLTDAAGRPVRADQRGNFRSPSNLSYSYADPFGNATGYGLTDTLPSGFAVVADLNPGIGGRSGRAVPPPGAPPLELARANSPNHGGAGQNVLYSAGAFFTFSPYVGIGQTFSERGDPQADGDNIYTALRPQPVWMPEVFDANEPGVFGRDVGPAHAGDSYLVPGKK